MFLGVFSGFFMAWGLGIALWFFLIFLDASIGENFTFVPFIGLIQWAYLIPLVRRYKKRNDSGMAAGLYIGGGTFFLLMSACFGLIYTS